MRLQRILLLRELGLGLPQIAEVLEREHTQEDALTGHLAWLRQEQDRLARQIASVESTIQALRGGERLMAENMFDGFDHTQYKDEVEQRWGKKAYADSDRWWRGMTRRGEGARGSSAPPTSGATGSRPPESGIAPDERRGAGAGPAPRGVADGHPRHARRPTRRTSRGT